MEFKIQNPNLLAEKAVNPMMKKTNLLHNQQFCTKTNKPAQWR
jgi:hypothetical protein